MVACESSGDAHGSHLIKELQKVFSSLEVRGLGGPRMAEAGMDSLYDMTTISALGLGDVLRQYFKYLGIFNRAVDTIHRWKPDVVVVIDSPAFNLRLAKKISRAVPVLYYIGPQLWAWAGGRIRVVQKHIARMMVILPFEEELYRKAGVPCTFVGHPLLDELAPASDPAALRRQIGLGPDEKAVGLMAGSRSKEVVRIFPAMLETAALLKKRLPHTRFFFRPAPNLPFSLYQSFLARHPGLEVTHPELGFRELIASMDFALVASGTATLETALIGTPYFLLYKASTSTYLLGKQLIRVPYLGLVNLLAGKSVVPEFIQNDMRPEKMADLAEGFLKSPEKGTAMKNELSKIRELLGTSGASRRTAECIAAFLQSRTSGPAEQRQPL